LQTIAKNNNKRYVSIKKSKIDEEKRFQIDLLLRKNGSQCHAKLQNIFILLIRNDKIQFTVSILKKDKRCKFGTRIQMLPFLL